MRGSKVSEIRNIVITGGTKGIGLVYASHLSKNPKNRIIITGRSQTAPESVTPLLNDSFHYRTLDVSHEKEVEPFFESLIEEFGDIDVLINNAGVWGPVGKFNTIDLSEWFDAVKINLSGVVSCTHAIMQHMIPKRKGIIINMVSNAGAHRWPTCASYSMSKAAVMKFTENVAIECKKDNISIYSFHPGLIHSTGMVIDLFSNPPEEFCATRSAMDWIIKEKECGHTVSAEDSALHIEKLCSGNYKQLSGLYLNVKDDLDMILSNIRSVRRNDHYQLRVSSVAQV